MRTSEKKIRSKCFNGRRGWRKKKEKAPYCTNVYLLATHVCSVDMWVGEKKTHTLQSMVNNVIASRCAIVVEVWQSIVLEWKCQILF